MRLDRRTILVSLATLLVAGCDHDELTGPGGGARVAVTTPSGVQTGLVRIVFTLEHEETEKADIGVRYSLNGGESFLPASEGPGSGGTTGLAVSPGGTTHVFVWNSGKDAAGARIEDAQIRISAKGGTSRSTGDFSLHNSRYVLVPHDIAPGRATLVRVDAVDGRLRALGSIGLGGDEPWDVLFHDGRYYVANRGSHDISVLELDELSESLVVVSGTPFASDGTRPRYLATDDERLFVSNVGGSTISIFDIDADTGALTLHPDSGVAAAGCRDLWARSGRLYVASESTGAILVFDIGSTGRLEVSPHSPVTSGGLTAPLGLVAIGTRLYAANFTGATLAGFTLQGDGGLLPIAGSPFSFTGTEARQVAATTAGDRLFVATTSLASFASLAVDTLGIATEDPASPHPAAGAVSTVVSVGEVVIVGSAVSETVEAFTISADGSVQPGAGDALDLRDPIGRLGLSD